MMPLEVRRPCIDLRLLRVVHRLKYQGPFSMDYRERGSHARSVQPTQDTSRMGAARAKQEEKTDARIMQEISNLTLCLRRISTRNNYFVLAMYNINAIHTRTKKK